MSIWKDLNIPSKGDRSKEELVYNLAACFAVLETKIGAVLKPYGLSPVKINALLAIRHANEASGLSQSELSKTMVVTAGNITRLIDRLEREKLVERTASSKDRRVNVVKITRKGDLLLDRVWPHYIDSIESMIRWPKKDIEEMTRTLEEFRKHLGIKSDGGKS